MNSSKTKLFLFFIIGVLSAFLVMYFINNYKVEKKDPHKENLPKYNALGEKPVGTPKANYSSNGKNINELTAENTVISYIKANKRLPDYYLTKSEARKQGWNPSAGNLCDVLPGKAIGGDRYSNRERTLPQENQYFEADVNYNCGNRNADRIIFTKNGEVWLTKNHYKSFQKQ